QAIIPSEAPDSPVNAPASAQTLGGQPTPILRPTNTPIKVAAPAQPAGRLAPSPADLASNAPPTPTPDSSPVEALDPTPPPPVPTPNPESAAPASPEINVAPNGSEWVFMGVQISYQDEEGVIIDGDIINNTDAPQDIVKLTGTIYDSQGQGVADVDNDAAAYWPLETVPPGGQVPFEMTIYQIQDIANFDLDVVAQPSRETPRQDFELADLDPSIDEGNYCVTGKLWNRGDPLLDYLLVLVILYNDQDKVVNFGTYQGNSPEEVQNDDALNFEVCTDSYNQQIARHELRAIGL
ncbi:MAG: DUF3426 domain-containing protein, partial [Anaerolineae bacterium]|nr:DUF3426 domain-containing protein [Anaerolineae bacterium]